MKKIYLLLAVAGLLSYSKLSFCQVGMGEGEKIEYYKAQSGSGFDVGTGSTSAKEQLEQISGQKISTSSSSSNVPRANPPKPVTPAFDANAYMKAQLVGGLVQGLLNFVFSDNTKANEQKKIADQKAAAEAAARAAAAAAAEAEARRIRDSIATARYKKMMESYKLLDDSKGVGLKKISDNNGALKLKTLDDITYKPIPLMGSAPLSEVDRFYQKHNIHYDFFAMNTVSNDRLLNEEFKAPEQDVNEQFIEKYIDKIGSFKGGGVAALAGNIMLNIKRQSFSYLENASGAVLRNDYVAMQEYANTDVRTLYKNALNETYKKYDIIAKLKSDAQAKISGMTVKAYKELGVGFLEANYNKDAGKHVEVVLGGYGKVMGICGQAQEAWDTRKLVVKVYHNNKEPDDK